MRFAIIAAFVAGTALAAHAATCTITAALVPVLSQGFSGVATGLVGVQLPVTIDERRHVQRRLLERRAGGVLVGHLEQHHAGQRRRRRHDRRRGNVVLPK
jgi:hypothetical protein